MKMSEIRKMETKQLVKNVDDIRGEIAELRRSIHMGESTNVRAIRNKRKQLARMLSVMSEQLEKETV